MTIISVAYVPEGIAMAADSRLTYTRIDENGVIEKYTITDNAQKLVLIRESTIGVSFCGVAILNDQTISDILRLFDIEKVTKSDSVEQVAYKLRDHLITEHGNIDIVFILSGFDDDTAFVYSISPLEVLHQNSADGNNVYGATWRGQTEPTSNALVNFRFNGNLMPLKDAADFAEFIVDFTIKYERFDDKIPTCGGPIDLLVITKDYTKFLKHKILNP